jgi:hypothetical protein
MDCGLFLARSCTFYLPHFYQLQFNDMARFMWNEPSCPYFGHSYAEANHTITCGSASLLNMVESRYIWILDIQTRKIFLLCTAYALALSLVKDLPKCLSSRLF